MKNIYESSREDVGKVLEKRSIQFYEQTNHTNLRNPRELDVVQDWEGACMQYHNCLPCSHFLATFLWQHSVAGLRARDIVVWTYMTPHTEVPQVPMCNLWYLSIHMAFGLYVYLQYLHSKLGWK